MNRMPSLVDMEISPEEAAENLSGMSISNMSKYPRGLAICLNQQILDKLDVDYSDWKVGDHFHLNAMAKITSISEDEDQNGKKNCRVEMQIVALSGEDEEEESESEGSY